MLYSPQDLSKVQHFCETLSTQLTFCTEYAILTVMSPARRAAGAAAGLLPLYGKKGFDPMKTAWKRAILGFVSLVLLCVLALAPAAGAATKLDVGVAFWKEKAEQTSLADDGVDHDRTATLTRQPNGTYTLELPVKKLSKVNIRMD